MRVVPTAFAVACALVAPAAAQNADPQLLSLSCAGCHGAAGRSQAPMPPLFGRSAEVVAQALREFRADHRPATIMNRIARGYTDAEIESTQVPNVHVIGDAAIAGAMPKSGFSANSQGKVAALAVVNALNERPHAAPTFVNTCYSLIAPDSGISVADVYRVGETGIVAAPNAGGLSPRNADAAFRASEVRNALGWYASMTSDSWGS